MSNSMLNKEQVFNQIVELQQSIESLDDILGRIEYLHDSQNHVESEEGKTVVSELIPDVAIQKVKAMGEIVIAREETIHKLLDFYLSVYQKLENAEEK